MKKRILYFFVTILTLSFTSCGNKAAANQMSYEKYEALIQAIEENDYTAAQEELNNIFGKQPKDMTDSSFSNNSETHRNRNN